MNAAESTVDSLSGSESSERRPHPDSGVHHVLRTAYDVERRRLVALSAMIVGDVVVAEEIVHDVFARLLAKPHLLRPGRPVEPYVRKAVVNDSRSRLRRLAIERRHRRTTRADVALAPEPPDAELLAALRMLPVRQRQAIALRFYDDYSVDQIAETLGISAGSVKTHLHRGLARLRETLEGDPT